jgi:lipoprotein-anchoring transpeptidase ErfK/SrfK
MLLEISGAKPMRRAFPTLVVLLFALLLGAQSSVRAQDAQVANAAEQKLAPEPEGKPEQAAQPAVQPAEQPAPRPAEQPAPQPAEQPAPQPTEQQAPQPAVQQAPQRSAERTPEHPEPAAESAPKLDLSSYAPGTIVVETSERKLHLVVAEGEVITYPVGVGKAGKNWSGTGAIAGKFLRPAWSPPRRLKMEKPWTPDYIPGGSPKNPMGAAAMTLNIDQYAIHGTNDPGSIGGFVSFGCIRMHNQDILDLYKRVKVGTRVVVLK